MSEIAKGVYFDRPKAGAPAFVKGRVSIKVTDAIEMLKKYKNEKDYVNLDLLEAKETKKLYFAINEWKPTQASTDTLAPEDNPF